MRPDAIVNPAVLFGQRLHVQQSAEYLPVQQFVSKLAVEALYVPVLPGRTWFDVQGAESPRW